MAKLQKKTEICPHCGKTKRNLSVHLRYCKSKPQAETQPVEQKTPAAEPVQPRLNLDEVRSQLGIESSEVSPPYQEKTAPGQPATASPGLFNKINTETYGKFAAVPYNLMAQLTKCELLKLTKEEQEQLGDALKPVGDKYLPDWFEQHAELVLLAMVAGSITANKVGIYLEWKKTQDEQQKASEVQDGNKTETGSGTA